MGANNYNGLTVRLPQSNRELTTNIIELGRSLGIRMSETGFFGATIPVFRDQQKALDQQKLRHHHCVKEINVTSPLRMRGIKVNSGDHMYLTAGFIPTHS